MAKTNINMDGIDRDIKLHIEKLNSEIEGLKKVIIRRDRKIEGLDRQIYNLLGLEYPNH
jgi:archaellum component FlaC